jgi:deferrochelatase/peroxidase EfeB
VTHAFVTVAIPFANDFVTPALGARPVERAQIVDELLSNLGNPARGAIAGALDNGAFVHFMSMVVVYKEGESPAHLVLDASTDGYARAACARLAETIGDSILDVLQAAGLTVPPQDLGAYLEKYRLNVGPGWFSTPGVLFAGTPGMSVPRIKYEAQLACWISVWLSCHRNPEPALKTLQRVRDEIFKLPAYKWAFVAEPVPLLGKTPRLSAAVLPLLFSLGRYLLWPLFLLPLLAAIVSRWVFGHSIVRAVLDALLFLGLEIALVAIGLGIAYRWLRCQEEADAPRDEEPNAAEISRIMAGENLVMQNYLAGASTLKPGRVRRITLRLVFWAVGALATYAARPGFLKDIGTIHFARWFTLPRTDTLLFLSNYDGSWESYLEDFIARAHAGLSAIWSNTRNFPKTCNLIQDGASDGERFKRWARRQQHPTRFWFSAYPNLKTDRIRTNAAIRHGFASATTEEDATQWLNTLGFPAPPSLESEMIPTLVFGGLSPLKHAHCLIVKLADRAPSDCQIWLRELAADLSYGDRVPPESAIVAGFTATGLRKLGLDEAALASFPTAFQHGMAAPWRARALGDTGANDPVNWLWGGADKESDAIVLLYAKDDETLQTAVQQRIERLRWYRHREIHRIALTALPRGNRPVREPFGFIDGISQPVIRGTNRWFARRNENDVIAPGEIILGYPDNLGYVAPAPDSRLFPGRNGTFLVARQLEQDPESFERFLDDTTRVIASDPRCPGINRAWIREWIAAKMVGRWREDGSSLVRHPSPPGTPGRITVEKDNDFLFGVEDPDGLRCPFGAHIRRANPRDTFEPGSQVQIGITNRHRILRVGRKYHGGDNGCENPGLLFMCVNSDIEGQFEFLQQTYVLGSDFHGLQNENDPICGHHVNTPQQTMSIPTTSGSMRIAIMRDFVTMRGGGYFFLPSKEAVVFLTKP